MKVASVGGEEQSARAIDPVVLAMDVEAMEVKVSPREGNPDGVVQVSERRVTADEQSSPD